MRLSTHIPPLPPSCKCFFCNHQLPGHCENSNPEKYGPEGGLLTQKGGGMFGYTDLYGGYDGGQAEYVRVPYADHGPRKVSDNLSDDQVLFLTDIFPTTYDNFPLGQIFDKGVIVKAGQAPVQMPALYTH